MPPRKKKEQSKKNNCKYQTIASTDTNYSTFKIMKEYDDLDTARNSYFNDIKSGKVMRIIRSTYTSELEKLS